MVAHPCDCVTTDLIPLVRLTEAYFWVGLAQVPIAWSRGSLVDHSSDYTVSTVATMKW